MPFPQKRYRRLRTKEALRRMIRETRLTVDDLIYPLFVKDKVVGVVVNSIDVTKMKELEEQLKLLSQTDQLTQIFNRVKFNDSLIQEINREVNTMSAKANDSSISTKAVEIKAELEKIREQAQNVE